MVSPGDVAQLTSPMLVALATTMRAKYWSCFIVLSVKVSNFWTIDFNEMRAALFCAFRFKKVHFRARNKF